MFYEEHPDIAALTGAEVAALRQKLGVRVSGPQPPKPCASFAHFGLDAASVAVLQHMDLSTPTPIQAQVCPVLRLIPPPPSPPPPISLLSDQ